MKTTRYFNEQVLRKRPYLDPALIRQVLDAPLRRMIQDDGRIRHWGLVQIAGDTSRYLRVVTLEDGETVHNAFFDRDFREDAS